MNLRKPLDPRCDGSAFCRVEAHVYKKWTGVAWSFTHIKLTRGQLKTLADRRALVRAQDTPEDR